MNGSTYYKRDSKVAKRAIIASNYCCEVDNTHKDFTSNVTKKNYVEAHHLIQMGYQDEFEYSLDVEANIISLCVGCHKMLHHSIYTEKKNIIKQFYKERNERLSECGIDLTLKELLNYYK